MISSTESLLKVYKDSIEALIETIRDLDSQSIQKIRDDNTSDKDCRSIQTVLEHCVIAGNGYLDYYRELIGEKPMDMTPEPLQNSQIAIQELNKMYDETHSFFEKYPNYEQEANDKNLKIQSSWQTIYDFEQLFEHAITHILRHNNQIKKWIF